MNGLMDFLQQTSRTAGQTATGLVDLATLALRPLGYSIPDEKVFGTTKWAEKKGLLAPESQTPAGLAGQTVGNLLFPLGAGKSTQIADGLLTAQANAAAPRVLRKESGMFIGPGAKTWDAQAAKKAQTMAAKGVDPKTIWNETGTFKGPDGMWRQEIDDSVSAFKMDADGWPKGQAGDSLTKQFLHKEVFDAYPGTKRIPFYADRYAETPSGWYGPEMGMGNRIEVAGPTLDAKRSVTLHELQHAIQKREGFAMGGDNLTSGGQEAYRRLAGEAEARATQARMNMNMAQRREVFPLDSYDVPIDQLIVRRGLLDGPAMMVADPRKKGAFKGLLGGDPNPVSVGTITDWQTQNIAQAGKYPMPTSNQMTADANTGEHLLKRKGENFNGDDLWGVLTSGMRKDAKVNLPDFDKKRMYPSLVKKGAVDPVTGKTYDATIPVAIEDGKLVIKTIVPDGLPARKKKTTWP